MTNKALIELMLEALKAAQHRMDRLLDDESGEHSPAYLQVDAAILKATGAK